MKYLIIDNFLQTKDFEEMRDVILSYSFPWYKLNYKINPLSSVENKNDEKYNLQFVHKFYEKRKNESNFMPILNPLLDKLSPLTIIKIKANLTTATHDIVKFKLHNDVSDPRATTGIFYLNTNNGFTFFSNGESVKSIANRLVLFDSKRLHSGTTCSDKKFRCVLNINFVQGLKFDT